MDVIVIPDDEEPVIDRKEQPKPIEEERPTSMEITAMGSVTYLTQPIEKVKKQVNVRHKLERRCKKT